MMQNISSKKIFLSKRWSPKDHSRWVFQCFKKIWETETNSIPHHRKCDWCIFVCVGTPISSGPVFISSDLTGLIFCIILEIHETVPRVYKFVVKLDCADQDHSTVLGQWFDGHNMYSPTALRGQVLQAEGSTLHSSPPHQNLLRKTHNPGENPEDALGNRQWLTLPGPAWYHSRLFLFSPALARALPWPRAPLQLWQSDAGPSSLHLHCFAHQAGSGFTKCSNVDV